MKKLALRLLIALVVLAILAFVGVALFLDSAVKRGVETVGPSLTKVSVKLQAVSLSLFSGSGKIKGLIVGNPEGFKTPSAINVGEASLSLQPSSLFGNKVIVKSVRVQAPEITFETDLHGNNLSKILANLEAATGGGEKAPEQPKEAKAGKKLQVDDFVITGAKLHVSVTALGGKSATVPLPDIHLQDLGKGPDGITPAELTRKVLQAVIENASQAATGAVTDLTKGLNDLGKEAGKNASSTAEKITKGLGDLLKKKK